MMKYHFKIILLSIVLTKLQSCQTIDCRNSQVLEELNGLKRVLVKGGDFWITTYQKVSDQKQPFVFYIEGDGFAFVTPYQVSCSPTPRTPMLINLAASDPRPNVVYIARLCQYTPMKLNSKCNPEYWTSKRFSSEARDVINTVINEVNNKQKFSLIGFSGGGAIAILVTAINPLTKDVITLAGNLDIVEFAKFHYSLPIKDSLNPIDYARKISHIPQLHLAGANDTIVPIHIVKKFVETSASHCVKYRVEPNVTHNKGWEKTWSNVLSTPLSCN